MLDAGVWAAPIRLGLTEISVMSCMKIIFVRTVAYLALNQTRVAYNVNMMHGQRAAARGDSPLDSEVNVPGLYSPGLLSVG